MFLSSRAYDWSDSMFVGLGATRDRSTFVQDTSDTCTISSSLSAETSAHVPALLSYMASKSSSTTPNRNPIRGRDVDDVRNGDRGPSFIRCEVLVTPEA